MTFGEIQWKGSLRNYNIPKRKMILPKINSLTGRYIPDRPSIHDDMNYRYSLYSENYWAAVLKRQKEYKASRPS